MVKTEKRMPHAEMGAALKDLMRKKGFTVAKLARAADVSVRHLNVALRGGNISITILKKVAGALGATDLDVGELTLHGRVDDVNVADVRAHLEDAIETMSGALNVLKQLQAVVSGERRTRSDRRTRVAGATELIKQVAKHAKTTRDKTKLAAAATALTKAADSD